MYRPYSCLLLLSITLAFLSEDAAAQLLGDRSGDGKSQEVSWLPASLEDLFRWSVAQQADFSKELREAVMAYRDGTSLMPAFGLIGLSFAYGIFHAVGPGHGKAVVTSYFMARESHIKRAIGLGWMIAGIQACVAVLLVAVLGWVLDFSRLALLDSMPLVEMGSYALVAVLGAGMTWAALTNRECGHDHTGLGGGGHDPHHDHQDHNFGHAHHHHLDHEPTHGNGQGRRDEFIAAAVVSGLRPCTGALIVLLFTLANGIFLIGILSALAMGVGVAITVSSVGIGSILLRRGILSGVKLTSNQFAAFIPKLLSVAGSIAVCLIGAALFFGAWQSIG